MNRTAEYHNLPLDLPLDPQVTLPTTLQVAQTWCGYVGLCLATVGLLSMVVTCTLACWAMLVAGAALAGWGLWGNAWLCGESVSPRCEDCGEELYSAGDVWVCWHCSPRGGEM